VAVGTGFGFAIVATVDYRQESLWRVWAALGVALTTAAGAVFIYGWQRWSDLPKDSRDLRDIRLPTTLMLCVAILTVAYSLLQEGTSAWRGPALVSLALVGAIPTACTMHGVRMAAQKELPKTTTNGERTARLIELGRLLRRRLLPAVGSLVALATLALGAAVKLHNNRVLNADEPLLKSIPPEITLVFGGMGSLLVALLYVPAASAIRQEGEFLSERLFSFRKESEGARVSELAEKRRKFDELLGIDRDFLADLQIGVVVLGPVISSMLGGFLPN
jgi:hypothetical protein